MNEKLKLTNRKLNKFVELTLKITCERGENLIRIKNIK